jgi:hypothetical protein
LGWHNFHKVVSFRLASTRNIEPRLFLSRSPEAFTVEAVMKQLEDPASIHSGVHGDFRVWVKS